MPQTAEEIKEEKEKNNTEYLETTTAFYSKDLSAARNTEYKNQKPKLNT